MDCHLLREFNMPCTLDEMGDGAFQNCHMLEKIDLSECLDWENWINLLRGAGAPGKEAIKCNVPKLRKQVSSLISTDLQVDMGNKIDIVMRAVDLDHADHFLFICAWLGKVQSILTFYISKDCSTLLELALWK